LPGLNGGGAAAAVPPMTTVKQRHIPTRILPTMAEADASPKSQTSVTLVPMSIVIPATNDTLTEACATGMTHIMLTTGLATMTCAVSSAHDT